MSKDKKTTYLYQNGRYVGEFPSIRSVSNFIGKKTTNVSLRMNMLKPNRSGYVFSDHRLSDSELSTLTRQEASDNSSQFSLPRVRKERTALLGKFIASRLSERWMKMNPILARSERRYVRELLDSLE